MPRRFDTSDRLKSGIMSNNPNAPIMMMLLAVTWFLLQPGLLGFDERYLFHFTEAIVSAHFDWNTFVENCGVNPPSPSLSQNFAWFLLQIVCYWPYWSVSQFIPQLASSVATQAYMGAALNLPIWIAIYIGWRVLRREGLDQALAGLTLAGVFAGSYAISVLPSSGLGNIEALLICAQLLLGETAARSSNADQRSVGRTLLLGLAGGYLVALRPYALPCVSVLAYLSHRNSADRKLFLVRWSAGFGSAVAIGFAAKFALAIPFISYGPLMFPSPGSKAFFTVYLGRWVAAFFSFSYGIFLTAPFLVFAFWARSSDLWLKSLAIMLVLAATLLFPFWAGESGIAGNRYIFAYLLILLPEVGRGFKIVAGRHPRIALVVPLLVLVFLPCMAFRHNVTFDYAVGQPGQPFLSHPAIGYPVSRGARITNQKMPIWNPLFHPAVFGWWQALSLAEGHPMVIPLDEPVAVPTLLVPPYGLVFRFAYLELIDPRDIVDSRIASAQRWVDRDLSWTKYLIIPAGVAVALAWSLLLGMAVRRAMSAVPLDLPLTRESKDLRWRVREGP